MSFFTLNCNLNLIHVLIYWILEIFVRLTMYYLPEYYKISNDQKENEYMFIIFPIFAKLLSGFLNLYVYCVAHRKKRKKSKDKYELIYENPMSKKDKFYYLKLLFITSLELIARACYFIFILANREGIETSKSIGLFNLIDILNRYVLSIFVLKIKTFKHRIWSIYAMIFGFFLIIPFDILDLYYEEKVDNAAFIIYIILLLLQSILYPIEDTYIKKFYNTYYILPEKMLFSIAICEALVMAIITPLLYYTGVIIFDLLYSYQLIIGICIYIIETFVREYIIIKIIYLFSSQSVAFLVISHSMSASLVDIINFIRTEDKSNIKVYSFISFPLEIIALIIIIFATAIYDEVIIIHKYGLDSNVKRGIIERSLVDIRFAVTDPTESFISLNPIN